jgi:hypothetical protein
VKEAEWKTEKEKLIEENNRKINFISKLTKDK